VTDTKNNQQSARETDAIGLGQRIRKARLLANLTLQEVADSAGVSRSLMSQVERGLASPSIATLRNLANAIGITVATLFYSDNGNGSDADAGTADVKGRRLVVRKSERKRLALPKSRVKYELLTPDLTRKVEFLWVTYAPGDVAPYAAAGHEGEENAVCIEGTLVVVIDGQEYILNAGDSISFDCSRPHRTENRSDAPAVVISAITPPSF
jgi:transcriptional regulator with XRE-family HTH domain